MGAAPSFRDASREPSPEGGDIVRFGTIASVDLTAARCTVTAGDLETGPIRWLAARAGATRCWSPPSVGEQVLLVAPEGDVAAAIAFAGVYSSAHPAPGDTLRELFEFIDGAVLAYDPEAHVLDLLLPDGATIGIVSTGGITINVGDAAVVISGNVTIDGDVSVTGTITADTDVIADGKSLKTHKHGQVTAGAAQSGPPA